MRVRTLFWRASNDINYFVAIVNGFLNLSYQIL